jgi:hypothetical protein
MARLLLVGSPHPSEISNSFMKRLMELEDRKIDLVLKGAFFKPELRMQFQILDRKLDKYYRWYGQAWLAGKV